MTQDLQSDSAVIDLDQLPQVPVRKRRTQAEKARILAHLVLQLVALNKEEGRVNGNA